MNTKRYGDGALNMDGSSLKELIPEGEIKARVKAIAGALSEDLAGKSPVFVGILNGAFIFLADLVREMAVPVEVDFLRAASYGESTSSSGTIKITKDVEMNVAGRDVVVVEDIVDTGLTFKSVVEHLRAKAPASLRVAVLIDKRERRQVEVELDYVGFEVPKGFLVGYGLDCAGRHRELRSVYEIIK